MKNYRQYIKKKTERIEIDMHKVIADYKDRPDDIENYMNGMILNKAISFFCDTCDQYHSGICVGTEFDVSDTDTDGTPILRDRIVLDYMDQDKDEIDPWEHIVNYDHPVVIDPKGKIYKQFDL